MKTLKKTLCLVLAVVMVLGLCVMSASAKLDNYSDADKITYAEAVDVMSGIGVLQGDEGGFRPTDTVRRSEAAKILAYLLVGNAAQADALKTNTDPFTDVPASHWAAGYIAYCAQRGIINGMGDGKFNPNDQVTGLQFAKMLLTALGYGVNDEYTGADWAINVSKDALTEGVSLFRGNLAGATNAPATREECALYAFNTLKVDKVSYSALLGGYVSDNAFRGTGAVNPNAENTIAGDFDLHDTDTDADAFQRPCGHHWWQGKTTNIISADYGNPNDRYGDAEDLQASYTKGVTGADLYSLLGKTFLDGAKNAKNTAGKDVYGDIHLYVNGVEKNSFKTTTYDSANPEYFTIGNFTKDNTKTLTGTGNGVETNVYAWSYKDSDNYTVNCLTITVVDTYLAKVVDVKAGTATKDPVTTIEYFDNVNVSGSDYTTTFAAPTDANAMKYNTDEFKEGDYVLVSVTDYNHKVQKMVPAVVQEGTISRYNNIKNEISVVSGGTTYIAAKNAAAYPKDELNAADNTAVVDKRIVNGKDHVLYVDEYGYLIAVGEVAADSDYVYVARFGYKNGDTEFDSDDIAAKVYYADGTDAIVTVSKTEGLTAGKTVTPANLNSSLADNIYKLTTSKGKAVLTTKGDDPEANPVVCVSKGVATVDDDVKANSKTTFFYVKDGAFYGDDAKDFSVEAFIGINNVPVANSKKTSAPVFKIIADDDGKALAVYVTDKREGEAKDTVYLYTGDFSVDEENWTVFYDVYVNGQPDTLSISYKDETEKDAAVNTANNFVNNFFTVDSKNNFIQTKLTALSVTNADGSDAGNYENGLSKTNTYLKAVDKFYYTTKKVAISSINVEDASLFMTGVTLNGTPSPTAIGEYAYGYSLKGVIDLVNNPDDDAYIGTVRAFEKAVSATGSAAKTYTVVVQFAENASNAIEYVYIVDIT